MSPTPELSALDHPHKEPYSPVSRVVFRLLGLGGGVGACLPGDLAYFLLGGTSSPLGPAPAEAPFGGSDGFLGLALALDLW